MYCLFAFNGELMCFVHVLLNALDMNANKKSPLIVIEGSAVKLIPELEKSNNPFHALYVKCKEAGLLAGVCKACSAKMGVLDAVTESKLPLLGDMNGHPSMTRYINEGYTIITF